MPTRRYSLESLVVVEFVTLIFIYVTIASFVQSAPASPPTYYWHPPTSGLPVSADVEAVVVNPFTPSLVYAGTFGSGAYRSADNGATWMTINTGITLPLSIQN